MFSRPLAAVAAAVLCLAAFPALALEAPAIERPAPDKLEIRWTGHDPVDVYVAQAPDERLARARRIAKADRSGDLTIAWTEPTRPYVILRDERDGSIARTAERLLPLEHGSNFRDMGGYPAAGGKHVRWGKIYRTAATPMLTDADFHYVEGLGLSADIDLRSLEERQLAPDLVPLRTGAAYFANDYPASDVFKGFSKAPTNPQSTTVSLYRVWLVSLAPQYRALFQQLLADKGAVTFHCSAGQDRSGVAAALILSALGVPRDVILADYHLSTQDRRPQYEMPPIDPVKYPDNPVAQYYAKSQAAGSPKPRPLYDASGVTYLQQTFDEIDAKWGSVDAYLDKELGVTPRDVARLRRLYLE
jgi:protein-tyrosine phosphatase